jgi:hypothetical protein
MQIIIGAIAGILVFLPLVLKLESWLNRKDEFAAVKDWHNFKSKMEKKS